MEKISDCSLNLERKNVEKLKNLFPEAVQEGVVNYDILKSLLGSEIFGGGQERYQFTWNGKYQSIKNAQTPSSATLRPCKEKSKNWDDTENLYIEGDNLEVLKQLQKTYYGKIKMIYIDPPYNTGNDFVYNDSFSDSIENYKAQTNQVSSSNPESNGRFHTDWLNMMYPRLLLAKNLLSDDGVIFISIDDHEVVNLENICNEIFGEPNRIATICHKSRASISNDKIVSSNHNFIAFYAKNITVIEQNRKLIGVDPVLDNFNYDDNDGKGEYRLAPVDGPGGEKKGNPFYEFLGITNYWRFSKETMTEKYNNGYVVKRGNSLYQKYYKSDAMKTRKTVTTWWDDVGLTSTATTKLKTLMNGPSFDTPKPIELIVRMLKMMTYDDKDSFILDFFSGSATTAHAVMKLNAEDGGNRKFIMIQLPELCNEKSEAYKAGYNNICDIGEERIRRAGEQIKSEWEKEHPSDGLFGSEEQFTTDIGFKVFKLDSTNVNEWDPNMKLDEKELTMRLGEVFKEGRSKEDILYEIMLKYGVFDKQVEEINVNGKTMYRVGKRYMIVCLEDSITSEDVKAIGELSPKTVIFNESGFRDDNEKINATYNLKQCGVEDIKCI